MTKIMKNGISYSGVPDAGVAETTTFTLSSSGWNSTTKIYTLSDSRVDATSVQEIIPAVGITDTQLAALQAANIQYGGQDAGHMYLKAYGELPSIDIPITVIFTRGYRTKEVDPTLGIHTTTITVTTDSDNGTFIIFQEPKIILAMKVNSGYYMANTFINQIGFTIGQAFDYSSSSVRMAKGVSISFDVTYMDI